MSENKWTPGPWGIEHTAGHVWIGPMRAYGVKVNEIVAGMTRDASYLDAVLQRIDANANLISAAPELAEACEALMRLARDEGWIHVAIESARAALAKARGAA